MKFRLIEPDISYKEKAIEYVEEFKKYNSKVHGCGHITKYLDEYSYETWLNYIDFRKNVIYDGINVPDETYFLIDEENNIIGTINIRLGLNDNLKNIGGHIGYSIRPTKRGKGYNKVNLYLGLKRLYEIGEKEALLDCEIDNIRSSGTMKALGGKLIDTKNTEKYGIVEKYVIDIEDSINKYKDIYEPYINNKVR